VAPSGLFNDTNGVVLTLGGLSGPIAIFASTAPTTISKYSCLPVAA
jgi:hypothetical protein